MIRLKMMGLGLAALLWAGAALALGQAAPDFKVSSGEEQVLSLSG